MMPVPLDEDCEDMCAPFRHCYREIIERAIRDGFATTPLEMIARLPSLLDAAPPEGNA